jgi:hypothetical protein
MLVTKDSKVNDAIVMTGLAYCGEINKHSLFIKHIWGRKTLEENQ